MDRATCCCYITEIRLKTALTHYQMTNFRLFQTERVCWRHFQIWRKWQKVIKMGRKHYGKRRNCSLQGELSATFNKFKIVVCKVFELESLKFIVWERVKEPFTTENMQSDLWSMLWRNILEKSSLGCLKHIALVTYIIFIAVGTLTIVSTTCLVKHLGQTLHLGNHTLLKEVKKKTSLTLCQTTDFRLFKTEIVCRRHFHIWLK